uniref:adenylate cyclase n=1 Tax=Photinus pyralis TaxID=7054 RepID=A0A1Y1K270_PHOPY
MSTVKRFSSVSFSKSEQDMQDDETFQLSLAPHVQTYLSQMSQAAGCWGKCLPIPFERAASKSWWDPTFDSEVLEEQYKKSAAPNNRLKFRYAIWYVLLISLSWFFYFLTMGLLNSTEVWPILCGVLAIVALLSIAIMVLTYQDFFNAYMVFLSFGIAVILCVLSLTFLSVVPVVYGSSVNKTVTTISPAGHFSVCIEILLLIYTILPLRLYMCITIGVLYSTVFELLTWLTDEQSYEIIAIIVRVLVHLCIHFIGLHIFIMSNVRMRDTFMQVGQSLLVGQQLKAEKNLKESMLHSLMPPQVAEWLMGEDEHFAKTGKEGRDSTETGDMKTLFRPFNMNRMENVSILFADIVGFTKISSTKTAEELVDILNQLFQKFDILCKQSQCEKISTLGDCYYCVSGCPQPRPDHAKCCVEMGLGMIQVIKQFDQEHNQGVNMRVGVHTGTVLCGIVGTKRFKFDVWSNDVTLANKMESTGKPGMVHISEKTYEFLEDMYITEDGQSDYGLKTYFIIRRRHEAPLSASNSVRKKPQLIQAHPQLIQQQSQLPPLTPPPPPSQPEKEQEDTQKSQTPSLQLIISPPTTPPITSPQIRPRVLSCDNSATQFKISHNPNMLSPDVCKIKASSLPSILDEQELDVDKDSGEGSDAIKTPTSTASSGRYSVKLKNWKIPSFLRKTDAAPKTTNEDPSQNTISCIEPLLNNSTNYKQVPRIIETHHQPNSKDDDLKEDIDVKSYISQSRSDIGQYDFAANELSNFIRSGSRSSSQEYSVLTRAESNRSRRGRSPNFDIVPVERSRSATVAIPALDRPKRSLDVPHRLSSIFLDDQLSTTYSVNSRKDSGIRSNSRRSSIQVDNLFTCFFSCKTCIVRFL